MRAVRFHGARDIRVDQIDEPVCGEDDVKVCTTLLRSSCCVMHFFLMDLANFYLTDPSCFCRDLREWCVQTPPVTQPTTGRQDYNG